VRALNPLIYRHDLLFICLDPYREIRVGTFDDYEQAKKAWVIYCAQGRKSTGFDYEGYDEYVTDEFRKDMSKFTHSKAEIRK